MSERQISQAFDALTAAENKYKETTDSLLGRRDFIRDQLLEIDQAKSELERTCADQDLLAELAATVARLASLHTRRTNLEQTITQCRQRVSALHTAAHQLLNPRAVSTRDESAATAEATDLHFRGNHHESQIPDPERQPATIRDQISAKERTESTLRNRLFVPRSLG